MKMSAVEAQIIVHTIVTTLLEASYAVAKMDINCIQIEEIVQISTSVIINKTVVVSFVTTQKDLSNVIAMKDIVLKTIMLHVNVCNLPKSQ